MTNIDRKVFFRLFVFGLLAILPACMAGPAAATEAEEEDGDVGLCIEEKKVISIFERCSPSVVFITSKVERRSIFSLNAGLIEKGSGSGFIWDREGHVVTNYHVIHDANVLSVTLADGSVWPARVVGEAPHNDLAVLRIDAPGEKLIPLAIGASAGLRVGQTVLAIGNPFGLDHTLTKGVISARGREIKSLSDRVIHDVIQTDAAINPGNSGGPLIDSRGRLIGINTAILSPSGSNAGIGFAVPVDTVKRVVPQVIRHGAMISLDPGLIILPDKIAEANRLEGAVVREVLSGSSAEKGGVEGMVYSRRRGYLVGDIIVAIAGEPVRNSEDYYRILEGHVSGEEIPFTIKRGRARFSIELKLSPCRQR
jgi:S1-C subfamily serine protease